MASLSRMLENTSPSFLVGNCFTGRDIVIIRGGAPAATGTRVDAEAGPGPDTDSLEFEIVPSGGVHATGCASLSFCNFRQEKTKSITEFALLFLQRLAAASKTSRTDGDCWRSPAVTAKLWRRGIKLCKEAALLTWLSLMMRSLTASNAATSSANRLVRTSSKAVESFEHFLFTARTSLFLWLVSHL